MIIGERIKNLRIKHGYTQEELANIFGIKKSTICTYEKERRNPPYKIIRKYMELFGVTADYLLGVDKLSIKEEGKEPFNYFAITENETQISQPFKKRTNAL